MASETSFDLIVIGGGPGGYVAAIRAAQLKMKVALVEAEHLGGICLNWGCIPTKALLRAAEMRHSIDEMKSFGITVTGEVSIDLPAVVKRSRSVAGRLSTGVQHLLKKNKVTVFDDRAALGARRGDLREIRLASGGTLPRATSSSPPARGQDRFPGSSLTARAS